MKKLLLAAAAITILAGPAVAADIVPPTVAPAYSWTGCYVGGNVAGGWSRISSTSVNKPLAVFGSETDSGFIGGGQVGCDYQAGPWVLGLESEFDFGRLHGSHPIPTFPTFIYSNRIPWVVTTAARAGYAVQPALLLYVRGGAAWTRNDISVHFTVPGPGLSESATDDRTGWMVGAGIEYMFLRNWSVFIEYNYVDFGQKTVSFTPAPAATKGVPDVLTNKQTMQMVLAGINFRFSWTGMPLVRKD